MIGRSAGRQQADRRVDHCLLVHTQPEWAVVIALAPERCDAVHRLAVERLRADAAELQALADQSDAPLVAAVVRNLQQQLANSHGQSASSGTLAQALLELHRSVADACA